MLKLGAHVFAMSVNANGTSEKYLAEMGREVDANVV